MRLAQILEALRRRRRGMMLASLGVLGVLVVVDALPGVVDKGQAHTVVERWPGFWAVFGLVGCAVLIVVSKAFGHAGVMTREDYYDE